MRISALVEESFKRRLLFKNKMMVIIVMKILERGHFRLFGNQAAFGKEYTFSRSTAGVLYILSEMSKCFQCVPC